MRQGLCVTKRERERPHLPSRPRGGRIQIKNQDHCMIRCRDLEARDPCRLGPGRRGRAGPANNHYAVEEKVQTERG